MTLTLRKHNKDELQLLIDSEMQAYAIRKTGFAADESAPRDARGNAPRKMFLGAVEEVIHQSTHLAVIELQKKLDEGYKLFTGGHLQPTISPYVTTFYVVKPQEAQAVDAAAIAVEVTAKYKAELEAHNDKVYLQEAQALKEEEARVAAELKAEDEAKEQAAFEKRVRDRMRGMK
ncbi:hypothetical protein QUC26_09325 [Pseudomonas asiatica]|uniref:hypothetical protein n=1 Tax=Pseudomonas asiatica TaxID=2219225 RepID=UPI00259FE153|nr:hypothetical protein [Pseudomonas asiatica]WJM55329.1 hypothetical protein QUC26_09325 [Pseudomonas asiatica]